MKTRDEIIEEYSYDSEVDPQDSKAVQDSLVEYMFSAINDMFDSVISKLLRAGFTVEEIKKAGSYLNDDSQLEDQVVHIFDAIT